MQSNVASAVRRADFAAAVTDGIATHALDGVPGANSVERLRQLPWQQLLEAAVAFAESSDLSSDVLFGPTHDGVVYTDTPMRNSADGLNADLPIMLGFTRDETRYWQDLDPALADPDLPAELLLGVMATPALPDGATADDLAALLRAGAPDKSPLHIGLSGLDDVFFRMPIIRQAENHTKQHQAGSSARVCLPLRLGTTRAGSPGVRLRITTRRRTRIHTRNRRRLPRNVRI